MLCAREWILYLVIELNGSNGMARAAAQHQLHEFCAVKKASKFQIGAYSQENLALPRQSDRNRYYDASKIV